MVGGTVVGGATGASVGGLPGFIAGSVAGGAAARVALGQIGMGRYALDRGVGGAIGAIAGGAIAGPVGAGVGFTAGTLIGGKALAAAGEVSETATRARLWQLAYNRARANGVDEVSAAQEAAFWAQLPACFPMRPRKAPITSRRAIRRRTVATSVCCSTSSDAVAMKRGRVSARIGSLAVDHSRSRKDGRCSPAVAMPPSDDDCSGFTGVIARFAAPIAETS
jgi:hypothetical protein